MDKIVRSIRGQLFLSRASLVSYLPRAVATRMNLSIWVSGEEINKDRDGNKVVNKFIRSLDENHNRIQWHRQQFGYNPPWKIRKRRKELRDYKIKMTPIWKEKKEKFIEEYLLEQKWKKNTSEVK